jgi:hypothetical protein
MDHRRYFQRDDADERPPTDYRFEATGDSHGAQNLLRGVCGDLREGFGRFEDMPVLRGR